MRRTYGTDVRKGNPVPYTFDRVAVREDIRHGQRVERFAVGARISGTWRRITEGTTIGRRHIRPPAAPVTATSVRVKVLQPRAAPHLGTAALHLSTAP
ncbi:hypothetical protein ACFVT1_20030 [Streptomyces sp. NPDC057963]|uniref:hypothetical protein n=1 Tax=Streptomyces sp. NPDC057963 TaxID=3346290 RepID=UPI0036E0D2E2